MQKDQTWFIPDNGLQSQAPPSVNINYNSQKHWVTSFQFENGDIYLLDSGLQRKTENCINDSLKIQLAQVYGSGKSEITVKVPEIQQQNNGHDCGLFAIAKLMEFITNQYSGLKDGTLEFDFIQNEMRGHLIKCFTQQYMEPFPKQKLKAPKQINVASVNTDMFCCCSMPDVKGIGPWIACDVCDKWCQQK